MPSSIWMRNYQDGGWMNMDIHTICETSPGLVAQDILDAQPDWLDIIAIIMLSTIG